MASIKEDRNEWAKICCRNLYGINSSPSKQFDTRGHLLYWLSEELGHLYQYRGVNAIERLIEELHSGENMRVRLSRPTEFNDPFDSLFPTVYKNIPEVRKDGIDGLFKSMCDYGYIDENEKIQCYREFKESLSIKNWDKWLEAIHNVGQKYARNINFYGYGLADHLEDINQKFCEGLRKNVLISCFSEDYTSPAMWHHYADGHQGVCLAYDEKAFCNYVKDGLSIDWLYFHLTPVHYRDDLYTLGKLCKRHIVSQLNNEMDLDLARSLLMQTLSTKAKCWSYEKEWRLIFFDSSESSLIENEHVIMKPSCIYLGAKINPYYAQKLEELGKKRNIPVKQLVMADTKYQLIEKKRS